MRKKQLLEKSRQGALHIDLSQRYEYEEYNWLLRHYYQSGKNKGKLNRFSSKKTTAGWALGIISWSERCLG